MAVNLHTTHFRFGLDELAENTHGWHAAEDVNPAQGVIAVDTTFLLRFTVQETGGTAASNTDNVFECQKNLGAWQAVTTTSTIAKAVAAIPFTNGQACTKRLSGTGTFETSGAGCTEDGTSGGAANDIVASGNSETECGLQIVGADVAGGDTVEFRLTSPDFTITNDVVPTVTVAAAAQSVIGASIVSGAALFAASLALTLSGATIGTGSTLFIPSVDQSGQAVTGAHLTSTATLGAPTAAYRIAGPTLASGHMLAVPTLAARIAGPTTGTGLSLSPPAAQYRVQGISIASTVILSAPTVTFTQVVTGATITSTVSVFQPLSIYRISVRQIGAVAMIGGVGVQSSGVSAIIGGSLESGALSNCYGTPNRGVDGHVSGVNG